MPRSCRAESFAQALPVSLSPRARAACRSLAACSRCCPLPASAERQARGDVWGDIAKVLPGRTAESVQERWEGMLAFKFMPSTVHGGGTKRARVGWDGDDGMAVQDMDLGGADGFNAAEWPGGGGGGGGGGGAAEGGESDDGSPPRLCLPTGNLIDDGTFCPDDELFLHARPPVRVHMQQSSSD